MSDNSQNSPQPDVLDMLHQILTRLDTLEQDHAAATATATAAPEVIETPIVPDQAPEYTPDQGSPLEPATETAADAKPADSPAQGTAAPEIAGGAALQRAVQQHPPTVQHREPPPSVRTLPVPAWCQLIDDSPDPNNEPRDIFATTDCGSQSCCMVTYSAQHVELPEGVVREFIHSHFPDMVEGLTTPDMLAWYLSSAHNNCPHAHVEQTAAPQLVEAIKSELADGCLVLILGEWYQGTLHWVVARGYDQQHLVYNDPWTGTARAITWSDYVERVNKGVIVVTRATARYE